MRKSASLAPTSAADLPHGQWLLGHEIVPLVLGDHSILPRRNSLTAAATMVLIALTMLRGLVPYGYMVDQSDVNGSLVIRICGGAVDRYITVDLATGHTNEGEAPGNGDAPDQDQMHKATCAFALALDQFAPRSANSLGLAFALKLRPSDLPPLRIAVLLDDAAPPLSARGPPAIA